MFIIGITGGSGGGKTSALRALRELGALTLDCDAIYHELLETCKPMKRELAARFPDAVCTGAGAIEDHSTDDGAIEPSSTDGSAIEVRSTDGSAMEDDSTDGGGIDRKKLAAIVFGDPAALADLEAITHKYVHAEVSRRLSDWERDGGQVAAIDAIALIESGLGGICDATVGVTAPKELRISRIMQRDGLTRNEAEARIEAQQPDSFYMENCDHMLHGTHKTGKGFEEECQTFFKHLPIDTSRIEI